MSNPFFLKTYCAEINCPSERYCTWRWHLNEDLMAFQTFSTVWVSLTLHLHPSVIYTLTFPSVNVLKSKITGIQVILYKMDFNSNYLLLSWHKMIWRLQAWSEVFHIWVSLTVAEKHPLSYNEHLCLIERRTQGCFHGNNFFFALQVFWNFWKPRKSASHILTL